MIKNYSVRFFPLVFILLFSSLLMGQYLDDPFQYPVTLDSFPTVGIAWGDYNNDGFQDLFLCNGPDEERWENLLYLNDGNGSFTRQLSAGSIVTDVYASMGASWGDFNNDGNLDLLVANPNVYGYYDLQAKVNLYVNQGNATFVDASGPLVVQVSNINKYAATWADVDNDGWLDALVSNAVMFDEPYENIYYHNNQDGTFTEISNTLSGGTSFMGGMAWSDFDRDGDMDVVVAGGSPGQAIILYLNDGSDFTPFTLVTAGSAGYSRGVSWADYDNDGDFDCYITNAGESVDSGERNLLFRFDGYSGSSQPIMTPVTSGAIVTDSDYSTGSAWADYDNDGDLDLFVANDGTFASGFRSRLYINDGTGSFSTLENSIGIDSSSSARGAAWADIENDGDLDLVVGRFGMNHLYVNNGNTNHYLQVNLVGITSNKSAIGSVVRIRTTINGNPAWQMREVSSQTGYGSQNSLRLHFGLGGTQMVDSLIIEWAGSGITERFADIQAGQILTFYEGESLNNKPVASDDNVSILEDNPVIINVLGNDSDPDNDVLVVADLIQGPNGTAIINIDSTITYTPDEDFYGNDFFYYIISDGSITKTDTARVDITVNSVNDAPHISDLPDQIVLLVDDSTSISMVEYASDVDTPYENLSWQFEVNHPSISFTFHPLKDTLSIFSGMEPGEFILYVTLTDDSSASVLDSVTVQVNLPSSLSDKDNSIPQNYIFKQNYPNPFNPETFIEFGIPERSYVMLEVFDITGRRIQTLTEKVFEAGYHSIRFSASGIPSGVYFYRIQTAQFESVKRMMLIK